MAMETKTMLVTPELAQNWMELNRRNRPIMNDIVNSYARAMLSGKWNLTHQGIAFDTNGDLIDGQHRLKAVITAGIPVEMNVTVGVERKEGELLEIDVGRSRSYKNIMMMSGVDDPIYATMNGVVMAFLRFKMGALRGTKTPAYVITDYIERHYNEIAFIAHAFYFTGRTNKNPGMRHAPAMIAAAGLSALYGHENRDAIEKFGQVYCTNDTSCCQSYNVKLALDYRDKLRNMRPSVETMNIAENAIRGFANNLRLVRYIDCYKLNKSEVL